MSGTGDEYSASSADRRKRTVTNKSHSVEDSIFGSELWTDGLLCAFEFVQRHKRTHRSKSDSKIHSVLQRDGYDLNERVPNENNPSQSTSMIGNFPAKEKMPEYSWVPIGWARISELVQQVQVDADWDSQRINLSDDERDLTVADLAAPYWEQPMGPTWWCHVSPAHPTIDEWLKNAHWLHPAVSIALRDESRLISEKMKHLLYEVPVRVAGGLLFELLGNSAGDPFSNEDDIPIVLRSWQAQNFLITAMHVKGPLSNINVLGIMEVQDLLVAGGSRAPKSAHEVIAHLACRLARWDDRLFRKFIFGAADEVELKFVHRRNRGDLNLISIILNQEIQRLSTEVIRVKWSLHAREEIVFELLQHLRGYVTKKLLEGIRESTRAMIEEQEAVRGRLFTIQDVMQSTVRAWLQGKSIRVTHNLAVFGGCGIILSIITGLFGINVDGIPGGQSMPYAFGLFAGLLLLIGSILIGLGMLYLGLRKPITEEQVKVRKLELNRLVKSFQNEAETHAKVRKGVSRHDVPHTAENLGSEDTDYILIV